MFSEINLKDLVNWLFSIWKREHYFVCEFLPALVHVWRLQDNFCYVGSRYQRQAALVICFVLWPFIVRSQCFIHGCFGFEMELH